MKIKCPLKKPQKNSINFTKKYNLNISVGKEFFPITNFKQKNLKFEFSTSNGRGREVEYYSSFIFSIDIKIKNKQKTFISGGRFNDLTSKILGLRKKYQQLVAQLILEFMSKEKINIGIVSKGRLKEQSEKILAKKKLKIFFDRGERELIGRVKGREMIFQYYFYMQEKFWNN